jgi:hypothetical protein
MRNLRITTRLFADRVQKFCFNNGLLAPSSAAERWLRRAGQIENPLLQNRPGGAIIVVTCIHGRQQGHLNSIPKMQYSKAVVLNGSCHIKARTLYNNEWSATSEQFFIVPEDYYDLKITEIHYHPVDEKDMENSEFEFIEIKNTGTSPVDLGEIRFTQGIEFEFPPETHFGPKGFIVLASNNKGFYER